MAASSLFSARRHVFEPVDTIVFVAGRRPRTQLAAALASAGVAHRLIGDALAPRSLEAVFHDGFAAAAGLSQPDAAEQIREETVA